jgi:hypothetical protein
MKKLPRAGERRRVRPIHRAHATGQDSGSEVRIIIDARQTAVYEAILQRKSRQAINEKGLSARPSPLIQRTKA